MKTITRAQVEDLLYEEAALLDAWKLDEWLALLTPDAIYRVPSNDRPQSDPKDALFLVADNMDRLRARVTRLKDPDAHAEYPPSRTRRLVTNVRIVATSTEWLDAEANFSVHRYRRDGSHREYVGHYRHRLCERDGALKIARREAILDPMELGSLGLISFIL
jgi:p-cumate 2,3-dioxygenase beta subunit